MKYTFKPAPQITIPVQGTDRQFPVRRIYCVGRNYAEHVREMGHDPDRDPPFFFQKNPDNLLLDGQDFPYPAKTSNVHHEIELVIALGKGGVNLSHEEAKSAIFGYAVALDMTRRDLQSEIKQKGRPWEISKAFEHSAPCSMLVPTSQCGYIEQGDIWLDVNGVRQQSGRIEQMIWNAEDIISYLSQFYLLAPGDIIMTGTPSGVGPVKHGDQLHGFIEGLGDLFCKIA